MTGTRHIIIIIIMHLDELSSIVHLEIENDALERKGKISAQPGTHTIIAYTFCDSNSIHARSLSLAG